MIFINSLRQYNEIHVITKPTCQVCVSAVRGGLLAVLYGILLSISVVCVCACACVCAHACVCVCVYVYI